MSGSHNRLYEPMPSYEEIQAHLIRARAMRAACMAQSLRKLGRMIVGRGAKAPVAPHGARTA